MVILQFNKLIRNKWVWGVFALAVSLFFCFDDVILRSDRGEARSDSAGLLGEKEIEASYFARIVEDVRGFGSNRDTSRPYAEVNMQAWEFLAALDAAEKNGLGGSVDDEVAAMIRADRAFQSGGGFSYSLYSSRLAEAGLVPERFEDYLKRRVKLMRIADAVASGASWASPAELEQAVDDMTDVFTVKVVRFSQDKKAASEVKVDDEGLRKWYDENSKSLALPERVKLRYVKFDATGKELLARMTVTDDEMHDHYDVMSDKYTSTDTNGVEKVKAFDEVKGEIEAELRQIAAVQYFETNLAQRVYGTPPTAKGASKLDEIAAADSLKVATSDYFSFDGQYQEGFMKRESAILPGAKNFKEIASELDPDVEDLRYGIVSSDKAVWLIERAEVSPAHTPSFDEAKPFIGGRALRDAKAAAFKASVDAVVAKGAQELLKAENVSTNLTFAVCDMRENAFPDQRAVLSAAAKLSKGGVSDLVVTMPGHGFVVYCVDRKRGDAAKAAVMRSQIAADLQMLQRRQIPEAWQKWYLGRIGFKPNPGASVTAEEAAE